MYGMRRCIHTVTCLNGCAAVPALAGEWELLRIIKYIGANIGAECGAAQSLLQLSASGDSERVDDLIA